MSNSAAVILRNGSTGPGLLIYSHWGGDLREPLAEALDAVRMRDRAGDTLYRDRIVFDRLLGAFAADRFDPLSWGLRVFTDTEEIPRTLHQPLIVDWAAKHVIQGETETSFDDFISAHTWTEVRA